MSTEQQQQVNHDHLSQSSNEILNKEDVPSPPPLLPPFSNFLRCYIPITRCQVKPSIIIY